MLKSTLAKLYMKSALLSGAGKLSMAASSIIIIWLLNLILGKDLFGAFMIIYALYQIISFTLAGLFQSLVLYHTPDYNARDADTNMSPLNQTLLAHNLITSLTIAAIFIFFAPQIALIFNKNELAPIFTAMALFIPCFTSNMFLTSYYRARQDVSKQALYTEIIPSIIRIGGLISLLFIQINSAEQINAIAAIFCTSLLLPAIILYAQKPFPLRFSPTIYSLWDIKHALSTAIGQLFMQSSRNLIIVLSGALATNAFTADFAIASNFTKLLLLPQNASAQILMPRIRAHMKNDQRVLRQSEYSALQSITLIATLIGAAFYVLFAPYVLPLFGDYGEQAYLLLIAFTLAAITLTAFGDISNFTSITGHSDKALIAHGISFITLLACVYGIVPYMGTMGMVYATILSALSACISLTIIAKKHENHTAINLAELIALTATSGIIIGFVQTNTPPATIIALAIVIISSLYMFIRIKRFHNAFSLIKPQ